LVHRVIRAAVLLGATSWTVHASAQTVDPVQQPTSTTTWEALTGVDYSVGSYGAASDTTVVNVPLNLRVQIDRLRLEVTVPYLYVEGPGSFTGGGIVVPGNGATTSRSGLGDVNAGAAWLIARGGQTAPSIELQGTVKVPTADTGLGTGKMDYLAQVNLYQPLSPQLMLFVSGGYHLLGDYGAYTLKDGLIGLVGANFKPSEPTALGLTLAYHQEYLQGLGDQWIVSPYASWNVTQHLRFTGYGLVGLTDASPSFGLGLRLGLYG
jgi:hypothetical protein